MTDLELCRLIDDFYIPRMKGDSETTSIYSLSLSERATIYETLSRDIQRSRYSSTDDKRTLLGKASLSGKTVSDAQLRRCLAL